MAAQYSYKRKGPMSDVYIVAEANIEEAIQRALEDGLAQAKAEEKSRIKAILCSYRTQWQAKEDLEACNLSLKKRKSKLKLFKEIMKCERDGKPMNLEAERTRLETELQEISKEKDDIRVPEINWWKWGINYM